MQAAHASTQAQTPTGPWPAAAWLPVRRPPSSVGVTTRMSDPPDLYARVEHGGQPVWILPEGGFLVCWADGTYREYANAHQMLLAFYGRRPPVTFDKYFRLGRFNKRGAALPDGGDVLSLFRGQMRVRPELGLNLRAGRRTRRRGNAVQPAIEVDLYSLGLLTKSEQTEVIDTADLTTWIEAAREAASVTLAPPVVLGIDLEARGHEVRKLLFAGFGRRIQREGYDPEDVLQEVYRGILARNNGRGAFDSRRSGFGHYVHMVCNSIWLNYRRKQRRRRDHEQVGMHGVDPDTGDWTTNMDAALAAQEAVDGGDTMHGSCGRPDAPAATVRAWDSMAAYLRTVPGRAQIRNIAIAILPYLEHGLSKRDLAATVGSKVRDVNKAIAWLQDVAPGWRVQQGF